MSEIVEIVQTWREHMFFKRQSENNGQHTINCVKLHWNQNSMSRQTWILHLQRMEEAMSAEQDPNSKFWSTDDLSIHPVLQRQWHHVPSHHIAVNHKFYPAMPKVSTLTQQHIVPQQCAKHMISCKMCLLGLLGHDATDKTSQNNLCHQVLSEI